MFLNLTGGTWQAIGAAAGPALAAVALTWHASDRLRRPRVDPSPEWKVVPTSGGTRDWKVVLTVNARVVNPRSSTIVVKRVELQARGHGERRVEVAASDNRLHIIKAGSEAVMVLGATSLEVVRDMRVVVRFAGPTLSVRGAWEREAGAAAFAKRDQMRARERATVPLTRPRLT